MATGMLSRSVFVICMYYVLILRVNNIDIRCRESSRDDLTSIMDFGGVFDYEDRFRVDRRKLEMLIMGQSKADRHFLTFRYELLTFLKVASTR